uniref:procollagen-proline 4-dioxygenase n=1 Tax=Cuerna arida TaxID=1464854 RepID=A0A1B6GH42_9HEMI
MSAMKVIYRLIPLICVALRFQTVQGDVFTSVPRMRELYLTEGKLLDSLEASIEYHQAKLDMLVQQHKKIMSQRTREGDTREYLDHPVDGFSLIKRLSRDWPLIVNIMAENHAVEILPTLLQDMQTFSEDTQGAIRGLTRLQKVYELDTDQLADGWIGDSLSFSKLNAADCVEIAQFLSQRHEFVLATSWMRAAQRRVDEENDTTVSQNQLASQLYTYSMLAMCEQTDFSILQHSLLSHDPSYTPDADTAKLFRLTLDLNCSWYDSTLKWDKADMPEDNHKKFNTMCRGEPKGPRGLKCLYVHYHRPELLLAPFKLEEILVSPPIMLIHQAISESEIEALKNASLNELSDCQTLLNATTTFETSTYRTCDKGWVDDSATPAAARVTRRIGQLANLGMTHSEPHQVACYGMGGEYKLHKDAIEGYTLSETNSQGQRIATVMLYLNDVTRGGYTVFPLLKVAVAPIKGSAVYWYNILHDSEDDERTLHGGCPVLLGSKWVLNKWIHEGGQEFQSLHCPSDKHFPKEYFYV